MHWSDRLMRRPAFNEPGHAHELTFYMPLVAIRFLKAERTCVWLAESLNRARVKYDFSLWAYVFMPDHVHLMIHPRRPDYDIHAILKAVKQPVGRSAVLYGEPPPAAGVGLLERDHQCSTAVALPGDSGNPAAALIIRPRTQGDFGNDRGHIHANPEKPPVGRA